MAVVGAVVGAVITHSTPPPPPMYPLLHHGGHTETYGGWCELFLFRFREICEIIFRESKIISCFREIISRFREIISRFRELLFRFREVLFREIIFRFREIISRFREIIFRFREIVFRFREIVFNSMYGSCLCTRCMLYDGEEMTYMYTPHMLKLCCMVYLWYTFDLEVNHA